MKHTGWRKPTPGLGIAEQLAQAGERTEVPKTRAFLGIKRVAAHIGLKAGDILLLDTLGAFTQPQDWKQGQRPIVWPSNSYLMDRTGFSLSALKRHARRLAEAGVIAFRDSPNGKRWGRRKSDGTIVEAYGFDLSPLAARVEEYEQLHFEIQAERKLSQLLRRQITVARRMIRARIDAAISGALQGPWLPLTCVFEGLLARLPRRNTTTETLEVLLNQFKQLQGTVERAYVKATSAELCAENILDVEAEVAAKTSKMNPKGVISEPHIQTTNQLISVLSSCPEKDKAADNLPKARLEEDDDSELKGRLTKDDNNKAALDTPMIMQACPEFAAWARNLGKSLRNWGDLHRVAGQLRPMIGVPQRTWDVAQDWLGKQVATAALALVFEKYCTGEVASPGGYLRGMVKKGRAGELHLERSFYGRLNAKTP
jgi:replication initiation protein RepC